MAGLIKSTDSGHQSLSLLKRYADSPKPPTKMIVFVISYISCGRLQWASRNRFYMLTLIIRLLSDLVATICCSRSPIIFLTTGSNSSCISSLRRTLAKGLGNTQVAVVSGWHLTLSKGPHRRQDRTNPSLPRLGASGGNDMSLSTETRRNHV